MPHTLHGTRAESGPLEHASVDEVASYVGGSSIQDIQELKHHPRIYYLFYECCPAGVQHRSMTACQNRNLESCIEWCLTMSVSAMLK